LVIHPCSFALCGPGGGGRLVGRQGRVRGVGLLTPEAVSLPALCRPSLAAHSPRLGAPLSYLLLVPLAHASDRRRPLRLPRDALADLVAPQRAGGLDEGGHQVDEPLEAVHDGETTGRPARPALAGGARQRPHRQPWLQRRTTDPQWDRGPWSSPPPRACRA